MAYCLNYGMLLIDIRSTNASAAEFILYRLKLYLAGRHHHKNCRIMSLEPLDSTRLDSRLDLNEMRGCCFYKCHVMHRAFSVASTVGLRRMNRITSRGTGTKSHHHINQVPTCRYDLLSLLRSSLLVVANSRSLVDS